VDSRAETAEGQAFACGSELLGVEATGCLVVGMVVAYVDRRKIA